MEKYKYQVRCFITMHTFQCATLKKAIQKTLDCVRKKDTSVYITRMINMDGRWHKDKTILICRHQHWWNWKSRRKDQVEYICEMVDDYFT